MPIRSWWPVRSSLRMIDPNGLQGRFRRLNRSRKQVTADHLKKTCREFVPASLWIFGKRAEQRPGIVAKITIE